MLIINWIKGLFAYPKTTTAGIGALAGAAAMGYGMYTGTVPINQENVAIASGLASAGIAGVCGKDAEPVKLVDTATQAAPMIDVVQQFQQMDANTAQEKLNNFASVTKALASALPPDTTKVP